MTKRTRVESVAALMFAALMLGVALMFLGLSYSWASESNRVAHLLVDVNDRGLVYVAFLSAALGFLVLGLFTVAQAWGLAELSIARLRERPVVPSPRVQAGARLYPFPDRRTPQPSRRTPPKGGAA